MTDKTQNVPPGRRRELSGETFACLLDALAPDREAASRRYEMLRRRLIDLFTWERSDAPEEAADETLNRLARRLSEGVAVETSAIERYAFGIARLVTLEEGRARRSREATLRDFRLHLARPKESDMLRRLERCLDELPKDSRDLIRRYYSEDRESLARSFGLTVNALRNRALRIREHLYNCVTREDRDV